MESIRLSKSRYVKGLQCKKYLWWSVHEKDSPELVPDLLTKYRFKTGHEIGALACEQFPGGFQVDSFDGNLDAQIEATKQALSAGEKILYEASFFADHTFVAVDVLLIEENGVEIIEVKSSSSAKPVYLDDLAIQYYVVSNAGLKVNSAKLMYLNKDCRYPDLSNLFSIEDVTKYVIQKQGEISQTIRSQIRSLKGETPSVPTGKHCSTPYPCPFISRCWPDLPKGHISTLAGVGPKRAEEFQEIGVNLIDDIVSTENLNPIQLRQIKSHKSKSIVIEEGLKDQLKQIKYPVGFLDFETIAPAVPRWDGCGPYGAGGAMPVQFSFHTLYADGRIEHFEWIAEGKSDPRLDMAKSLVSATKLASSILVYSASVEKNCIKKIISGAKVYDKALMELKNKIIDLLPIVKNNVYHPQFKGSFSIKSVLPALVPGISYDNLKISEGMSASIELERLILCRTRSDEYESLKYSLLKYCELDTLAMVHLFKKLVTIGK